MQAPALALGNDSSIEALYLEAAKATAAGSKSFYLATRFFPKDLAHQIGRAHV